MPEKVSGARADKTQQQVNQVSTMLNDFSFDYDGFCRAFESEHRTLQQSFTRLCIAWIATCADPDYRHDLRNEASHEVCKAIVQSVGADYLGSMPMI